MRPHAERIVVVGCGGIGSWLLAPLLRFLNAERYAGEIHLWDGDRYAAGNAERQEFAYERLGANKAQVQAECFQNHYPALRIYAHSEYVTDRSVADAVRERTIVLVAVDNHPARRRIALQAERLRDVCVLSAGNERLDGNVHVTVRRGGRDRTVPLLTRHPEIAQIQAGDRAEAGCEDRIEQGETQLLVTNFMAAAGLLTAFHALWTHGERRGRQKPSAIPEELYFDAGACAMALVPAAPR